MRSKKGFVLIPDRQVLQEAIALNKTFDSNELKLDLDYHVPHVTVLQTFFSPNFDYKAALQELRTYRGFTKEARTLLGEFRTLETHNHTSITWWNVNGAEWLTTFNSELIEKLQQFIVRPDDADKLIFESPAAKESYELTGYARNLKAYEPHITVAVGGEENKNISSKLTGKPVRFHRLAFVEHGDLGEITRILAEEELPVSWEW